MSNPDCIFCQIASGDADAHFIYQDDELMVLMDLFPIRSGHVLVIPKEHHGYLREYSPGMQAKVMEWASKITQALIDADLSAGDANILINDGKHANQHIPHLHLHVIPRSKGDLPFTALQSVTRFVPLAPKRKAETLAKQAKMIASCLA